MPQLSCESCAQRKVRCDKAFPCSTCEKMNITCVPVQRMRLPRGRHVHTLKAENKELREKLERLESQGSDQSGRESASYQTGQPGDNQHQYTPSSMSDPMRSSVTRESVSSHGNPASTDSPHNAFTKDFWSDISRKDPGLGDLLDQTPSQSVSDTHSVGSSERRRSPSQHSVSTGITGTSSFMLGFGQGGFRDPGAYLEASMTARPTPEITAKLWDIYANRVDPITRIFHQPTLKEFILNGKPYLKYNDSDPTLNLIRSSIFFVGIASLQDSQCKTLFGVEKQAALDTYRTACEVALDQMDIFTTEDITVLQSFMLYLFGVRTYDRTRKTWMQFSLAVRGATALGINEDDYRSYEPFFDQQMRRRLWYAICSMDAHLAFDRASKPLIAPNSRHPQLPHNINEEDFGPLSSEIPEKEGITDMSLPLMLYRTQATGKGLNFVAMMSKQGIEMPDPELQAKRKEIWSTYEQHMTKMLAQIDPNSSPTNWCLYHNGFAAYAALQLTSLRPTKAGNRQKLPVNTEPTNVLRMAVTVLEHDLLKRWDVRGEAFHWHGNTLWNPLAVAISECYTCNDILLVQQVWPMIETHFNCLSTILAEYRQGILWQPLERLIAKTRVRVRNAINQYAAANGGMLSPTIYYPLQPFFPEAILKETMIMPSTNYPTLSMSSNGLLPAGVISAPYSLTPAPWSPLQTRSLPIHNPQAFQGQSSAAMPNAYHMDQNNADPGWETWDNFLCQINFDMNVQGP